MRNLLLVLVAIVVVTSIGYPRYYAPSAPPNPPQPRVLTGHGEPALPPGPGRTQFATNCIICHSARYVTTQPRFPRKFWETEVQKMVTAYKAPIGEADQIQIVNYIVATFGTPDGGR